MTNRSPLVNRDEVRRLEKAAREKDKKHLGDWINQFVNRMDVIFRKEYEALYQDEINNSVQNLLLALAYTLHFSEEFHLDKDHLPDFINDLMVTIDMFRTGEYKPEDYKEELEKCGVYLDESFDYQRVYKERLKQLNELTTKYIDMYKELNNTSNSNENPK